MTPEWDDDGLFYLIIIATSIPIIFFMPWYIQLLWAALGLAEMGRREANQRTDS